MNGSNADNLPASQAVRLQTKANRSTRDHWSYFASHRAEIQKLVLPDLTHFGPAAPRLCDLVRPDTLRVGSLSRGFANFADFRFHQCNFGVATEWTDGSLHSLRAGETGIKERHSIDTMLSNAQIA